MAVDRSRLRGDGSAFNTLNIESKINEGQDTARYQHIERKTESGLNVD